MRARAREWLGLRLRAPALSSGRPERSNERMNVGLRVVGRQHNKFGIRSPRFLRQLASVPLVGLAVETQNCEICDACQRSGAETGY